MQGFKQWFPAPVPAEAPFRIRGIGFHERMRPVMVDRRAGTPDYLIMCFHSPVRIWEREGLREMPPASIILWEPGRRHGYGAPDGPWDHSWIHCEGPFLPAALRAARLPRNRALAFPEPSVFERCLVDLHAELTHHRHPDPVLLRALFEVFLRGLARQTGKPDAVPPVPTRFRAVKAWIDSHYGEPVTLAMLARQAHLSVPHFCGGFKRCFGVPAIEYLIRVRMQAAMHQLGDANLNITEVARLAGYENLFHFSRLFKQRFGVSPKAMRKRMAVPGDRGRLTGRGASGIMPPS